MQPNQSNLSRREFIETVSAIGTAGVVTAAFPKNAESKPVPIIKPPRLQPGDTLGVIAPGSPVFEPGEIREGVRALEALGFRVKIGKNVAKKRGYLAGTDAERAEDVMHMFADEQVKGIVALRGGYGCVRILPLLDYELIKKHPKVLLGYSDITSLLFAVQQMTGLVTFHGPVALSSYTEYTRSYFFKILTQSEAVGKIENPPDTFPIRIPTQASVAQISGRLTGGNLSLVASSLGTPYAIETENRLLFLEEVGEEPYHLDRFLTQLLLAGKLGACAGIVIDRCKKCGPAEYKPAFNNTLSVEEVMHDRLSGLNVPVLFGLSFGHIADKPVLPLGIAATLDLNEGWLALSESAVV